MKTKHYLLLYVLTIMPLFVMICILNESNTDKATGITDSLNTIKTCKQIMTTQANRIILLETELHKTQIVKVSFYHPSSRGINSDSDHTKTATMTKPVVGRTVAISDELITLGWLGCKVYIRGYGVFWTEDKMKHDIIGKQIDICVGSRKQAIKLGIKPGVVAVRL